MKKIQLSILTIVALCSVQSAAAWGGVGHHSAAYIAEQHLTPEAKEKCRYYLKHTLSYYAMWMDRWRGIKEFEAINNGHSIRTTDNGRKLSWAEGYNVKGRAMGHLVNAYKELGNGNYKNLPDSVVRQRLINMVHYVADMHCPSHCGFPEHIYPLSSKYNLKRNGKFANFHSFWDGSPGYKRKGITVKKYHEMIDKVSPKEAKKWQTGLEHKNLEKGLEGWAKVFIKHGHEAYAILPEGTDIAHLTKEQQEAVHDLADRSILVAAYRLAYVLNTIFKE